MSLVQILEKLCVCFKDQIFGLILRKRGHSFCLDEILYIFENWSYWVKTRSLGQIIEDPMFVTKGLLFKSQLLNAIPFNQESSGEWLQGHHGPLVYGYT